jgi:hypothetical protein
MDTFNQAEMKIKNELTPKVYEIVEIVRSGFSQLADIPNIENNNSWNDKSVWKELLSSKIPSSLLYIDQNDSMELDVKLIRNFIFFNVIDFYGFISKENREIFGIILKQNSNIYFHHEIERFMMNRNGKRMVVTPSSPLNSKFLMFFF